MKAVQIQSSEGREAEIQLARALGAQPYKDSAGHIFVVHESFKGFPLAPGARVLELSTIPEGWELS